jgi:methylmalonyl-CoA/ethylmalonyl-CoA epimerase
MPFAFHHVGVAVPDLEPAIEFYLKAFGFRVVSGPFEDPIQKVKLCFLAGTGNNLSHLELISPLGGDSPVNGYLAKGIGAYHVCYEVEEITSALAELRAKGCLVISKPVPAVAFAGRKIAWCFTPTNQLVELLERDASGAE